MAVGFASSPSAPKSRKATPPQKKRSERPPEPKPSASKKAKTSPPPRSKAITTSAAAAPSEPSPKPSSALGNESACLRDAAVKAAHAAAWAAGAAKEAAEASRSLAAATWAALPFVEEKAKGEQTARELDSLVDVLMGAAASGLELTFQVQSTLVLAAQIDSQTASGSEMPLVLQSAPGTPSLQCGGVTDSTAVMLGAQRRPRPPSMSKPGTVSSPTTPGRVKPEASRKKDASAKRHKSDSERDGSPPTKRHVLKPLSLSRSLASSWKVAAAGSVLTGCKLAEWRSERYLAQAARTGRKIRDADVASVLDVWQFRRNDKRKNVMRDEQKFVFSEMLGLIRVRAFSKYMVARQSRKFPPVTRLLCQYLYDNPPAGMPVGQHFPFTTICINKDYAAKRHRDNNNLGLSVVRALGNFQGGQLKYWPEDPGPRNVPDPEDLREDDCVLCDVKGRSVALDSTRAHEVQPFEGRRYSIVYFTVPFHERSDKSVKECLATQCGMDLFEDSESDPLWRAVPIPTLTG